MQFVKSIFYTSALLVLVATSQKAFTQERGEFSEFGPYRLKLSASSTAILLSETHNILDYKSWSVVFGSDTLYVNQVHSWHTAGTLFYELNDIPEGVMSVCGNYRSPGFCRPDFSSPTALTYNSDYPDLIYGQLVTDTAKHPETQRLIGEVARMESIMAAVERERIFEEQAYAEMQKIASDYESGPLKSKGVELKIDYEANSWKYDAHYLSISYSFTRYLPDSSFQISALGISGTINDLVSFSILRESLSTLEINTD